MPRLGLVLVVHREQGFLRPALTSVLAGAPDDLEVVVVDDAAPDHSGDIADEVAARDPRVRVVHLPHRVGPGPARAAGLAEVGADHVWFMDSIDLLPEGALASVLATLESTGSRVLQVPYVVQDVYGQHRPGPRDRAVQPWQLVLATDLARQLPVAEAREAWGPLLPAPVPALSAPAYVRRDVPRPVRARSGGGLPVPATDPPGTVGSAGTVSWRRGAPAVRHGVRILRLARHPRRLAARLRRVAPTLPARAWYRWQLRRPLEPDLAVFAAYWYAAYSCNPRAVYEKARQVAPWLRGVWVVAPGSEHVLPPGVAGVVSGTRAYYRLMARATYLVNNVNFPNDVVKRPGQVHLQTHHGTPLKTMGMDLASSPYSRKRMNFPRLLRRVARWDFSISQNAFTSEYWERVYPSGTYESLETGYPRNDVLATATDADVRRARADIGLAAEQTAVLYLPTHREYHDAYVPQLDPGALARALGPSHVVLMRTHYFYRDGAVASGTAGEGVLDVADHPRIEDLYLAADVLVTDYSSAMFDYAVLDRPIVVYAPDWEEYRTKRGTTFDLLAEPPGAVARTQAELAEVLASGRAWDDDAAARRERFRARFTSLEDGRAAERVVRRLWPAPPGGHA